MMHKITMPVGIINLVVGILLLTSGRKLFWLFVGCIGFIVGFHYAPYLWHTRSDWALIAFATLTGAIGAVLAVVFQKVAVGLAGFAAGGYIAMYLMGLLRIQMDHGFWLPYLVGGITGSLLLFLFFDWALIVVSSFAGASMIVQAVDLNPRMEIGMYFVLVIVGFIIQTAIFPKS